MTKTQTAGFSLIEVTLAIGITAFCLLAVFGLLPVAQTSNQTSTEQTAANAIASEIISDLRATQTAGAASPTTSPRFGLAVPSTGDADTMETLFFFDGNHPIGAPGTAATQTTVAPRSRVTIYLTAPASGRMATTGRIVVTWPAMADPIPSNPPTRYTGSYETFVALDRN